MNPKFGRCQESEDIQQLHTEKISRNGYQRDSGYPLQPQLLTPVGNPGTAEEQNYNNSFCAARATVERGIGLPIGRQRCLCKQRMLHYKPSTCGKISACAALHNICINNNDGLLEEEVYHEPNNKENIQFPGGNALHIVGMQIINFVNQQCCRNFSVLVYV